MMAADFRQTSRRIFAPGIFEGPSPSAKGEVGFPLIIRSPVIRSSGHQVIPKSARTCFHDDCHRNADLRRGGAGAHELAGVSPTLTDISNDSSFRFSQEPDERLIAGLLVRGRP
jgi:hypothetical protein